MSGSFVAQFLEELKRVGDALSREEIQRWIDTLFTAWQERHQVFFIGNGGSAGTASHFACDLNKVASVPGKPRFRAISLVDNPSLLTALINDEGWENVFVEQLENFFEPGDVLIGISVHGGAGKDKAGIWSQNILKAMKFVKERGGKVLGLSGFDGGPMKEIADVCITVPAYSTPQVESFHVVLHHLIAYALRERIQQYKAVRKG